MAGSGRFWCYYCDSRHPDEKVLLRHQRAKHFLCKLCNPPQSHLSLAGLKNHCDRKHKQELEEVPGAVQGRRGVKTEVMGMKGIPQDALDRFNQDLQDELFAARWAGESDPTAPPAAVPKPKKEEPVVKKRVEADPDLIQDDIIQDDSMQRGWPIPAMQPAVQSFTELSALAAHLANELKDKSGSQSDLVFQDAPVQPRKKKAKEINAFDPSLLAARIASKGQGIPEEPVEPPADTKGASSAAADADEAAQAEPKAVARAPISMAFAMKKKFVVADQPPKIVVDKRSVDDFVSAAATRAAAAAAIAAKAAQEEAQRPKVSNLYAKLATKKKEEVLRFARDVGVSVSEINSIKRGEGEKASLAQLVLDLEADEAWMTATFKPGKLGIKADWPIGRVKAVTDGEQGEANGVKDGMIFVTIDGQKFNKDMLVEKISGMRDYKVVFATTPADFRPMEIEDEYEEYSYTDMSGDEDYEPVHEQPRSRRRDYGPDDDEPPRQGMKSRRYREERDDCERERDDRSRMHAQRETEEVSERAPRRRFRDR